eukprot:1374500-Amorphochlora_amoeboformis.AAC.1
MTVNGLPQCEFQSQRQTFSYTQSGCEEIGSDAFQLQPWTHTSISVQQWNRNRNYTIPGQPATLSRIIRRHSQDLDIVLGVRRNNSIWEWGLLNLPCAHERIYYGV